MKVESIKTECPVLITGGAGFIGFHLSKKLLESGYSVVGYDNVNDYYDTSLKYDRIEILKQFDRYEFVKDDLINKEKLVELFIKYKFEIVINLGAQAGVRYSIDNPDTYINSNVIGFYNILEVCRNYPVKHLIYASSSSVYGNQRKIPFSVDDSVDHPISLYAATKKTNELMAYTYSHLYGVPATGLRFFTVYGPFGRPDMAYFSFAKKIMNGETIKVFNNGDMLRDFTYVDDIVKGIVALMNCPPDKNETGDRYALYNIGNNKPVRLMDFISTLEHVLGRKAVIDFLPMQPGDVYQTYADVSALEKDFGFKPSTTIEEGLSRFGEWFRKYYNL